MHFQPCLSWRGIIGIGLEPHGGNEEPRDNLCFSNIIIIAIIYMLARRLTLSADPKFTTALCHCSSDSVASLTTPHYWMSFDLLGKQKHLSAGCYCTLLRFLWLLFQVLFSGVYCFFLRYSLKNE